MNCEKRYQPLGESVGYILARISTGPTVHKIPPRCSTSETRHPACKNDSTDRYSIPARSRCIDIAHRRPSSDTRPYSCFPTSPTSPRSLPMRIRDITRLHRFERRSNHTQSVSSHFFTATTVHRISHTYHARAGTDPANGTRKQTERTRSLFFSPLASPSVHWITLHQASRKDKMDKNDISDFSFCDDCRVLSYEPILVHTRRQRLKLGVIIGQRACWTSDGNDGNDGIRMMGSG